MGMFDKGKTRKLGRTRRFARGSKPKPPPKAKPHQVKPYWYKMAAFWSEDAQEVMKVNDEGVLLCGNLPPDNDVAVVLVPTSCTQEQGMAIQKMMEANMRGPVVVLSNNTQLVRLEPISDAEAKQIMEAGSGRQEIIQVEKPEDPRSGGEAVESEGAGVRAEDR